ncbi:serine/threonine-protein phosphatase [Cellvibrio sp. KY-GH-1]|uniref:PP2C family protein-serine/threonine phosphatase n=1 Tax=Cellvibrio sp. KY-GH-1 TaxID=2303332 RepID=UPI001243C1F1|nr:PP2C family serine/threonine-protein phosphatase [Cellvibrio sp. KY-GH-1]QEY16731.1 serine/threonine-protein phosphatase [Cellvibrio sp. KY-GH-1]
MSAYLASSGMTIEYATLSRQGARDYNEDACGYWTSDEGACFIVADGAGGHGGGDVASETAVKTFLMGFSEQPAIDKHFVDQLLQQADSAIRYGQTLANQLKKMSTTVACLFLNDDAGLAQWTHLGDTRIYLIRRRQCRQLTKDHSLLQRFLDNKTLSAEMAQSSIARNILYAALGTGEEIYFESLESPFQLQEGDAFLLCSDGFWEGVDQDLMVATLGLAGSAEEWLIRMEQIVLERNSAAQDNYSALAVWIGGPNDITLSFSGASPMSALLENS